MWTIDDEGGALGANDLWASAWECHLWRGTPVFKFNCSGGFPYHSNIPSWFLEVTVLCSHCEEVKPGVKIVGQPHLAITDNLFRISPLDDSQSETISSLSNYAETHLGLDSLEATLWAGETLEWLTERATVIAVKTSLMHGKIDRTPEAQLDPNDLPPVFPEVKTLSNY